MTVYVSARLGSLCSDGISSYIIRHLQEKKVTDTIGVAYLYFSYKDTEKQTLLNLIASLLQQLVTQKPLLLQEVRDLYQQHVTHHTRPSAGECSQLLQTVIWSFTQVYIVVDALDECPERGEVRNIFLTQLFSLQPIANLLLVSRTIPSLESTLERAVRIKLEPHEEDIRNYLLQRLKETPSMKRHFDDEPSLPETIISRLTQKIKGMYGCHNL